MCAENVYSKANLVPLSKKRSVFRAGAANSLRISRNEKQTQKVFAVYMLNLIETVHFIKNVCVGSLEVSDTGYMLLFD